MKTHAFYTLAIIILSFAQVYANQENPQKTCFYTKEGIVEIWVRPDNGIDSMPDYVQDIYTRDHEAYLELLYSQFDLSQITKPEPDADDVTIDTKLIFHEIMVREYSLEDVVISHEKPIL